MDHAFSKIVAILTTAVMFFLVPLYINLQRKETMIQLSIMTDTVEFVDSVRNMGYLSTDMYERFEKQIRTIQTGLEIMMVHTVNSLHMGEDGIEKLKKVRTEGEILEQLQAEDEYFLQKGDYFRVEVKRSDSNILEEVFLVAVDENVRETYVYYGGSVRYEV